MEINNNIEKKKTFTFQVYPNIWIAMQEKKKQLGVSYTAQINIALEEYYKQK